MNLPLVLSSHNKMTSYWRLMNGLEQEAGWYGDDVLFSNLKGHMASCEVCSSELFFFSSSKPNFPLSFMYEYRHNFPHNFPLNTNISWAEYSQILFFLTVDWSYLKVKYIVIVL